MPNTDKDIPEPRVGIDEDYDRANETVNEIKAELAEQLLAVQRKYNERRICFSHAKMRYEIEIPEDLVKGNKKPREFELTSTRKGYERFHTPALKMLVERLEIAEERLKDALSPFLTAIFRNFHE